MLSIARKPAQCRRLSVTWQLTAFCAALVVAFTAFGATRAQAMGNSNTILRANPDPVTYGQSVTLSATVVGGVNDPFAGKVEFFNGATSLNPGGTDIIYVNKAANFAVNEYHACSSGMAGDVANETQRFTTTCWGDNSYGQIGDGSTTFRAAPTFNIDLDGILDVAAGLRFTCALRTNNGIACWGDNSHNQLGQGSSNSFETAPIAVTGASSGMVAIASGGFHSCAISANVADMSGGGTVLCWGENAYGQLGNTTPNTTSAAIVAVSGISTAIAIATGYQHSCALLSGGTVKCWGHNGFGQIGSGAPVDGQIHATPVTVPGITNATAIASTKNHTCVALLDGTAKCWGANDRKQLGGNNGGNANDKSATPVTVLNVSDALTIAAGYAHSCVVRSSGVASCWGDNQFGQLGNSTISAVPQDIVNVTGLTVNSLVAGGNSTCAMRQVGEMKCWGHFVGDLSAQSTPSDIPAVYTNNVPASAQARISVSALKVGNHTITAVFSPDPNNNPNDIQPSTSNSVSLVVQGLTSTTTVTANQNPGRLGDDATFTVSVSGVNGPAGSGSPIVELKVDGNTVDSRNVVSGSATLTATGLVMGTHTVQAFFSGDDVYAQSQSAVIDQTVKGLTTLAASATPSSAKSGQSVMLTATMAAVAPASGTPGGQVTFTDNGTPLGNVTVAGGQAQLAAVLKVGSHNIAATYSGGSEWFGSANTSSVTVQAAVGSETNVNTTVANAQRFPAATRLKTGYLVAWASDKQDGSGPGIYARRFRNSGAAAGGEIKVNTTATGAQSLPAAAVLKSGVFVVVWQSAQQDKSGKGIYGQRFSAKGVKVGAEFLINTTTKGNQSAPAIAALSDGGFIVTWTSTGQDSAGKGIYAKRFKANGAVSGAEFKVNKTTAGNQSNARVAPLGHGFVIAWQGPDGSGLGIFAQRFDKSAKPRGRELKVNTVKANDQSLPSIATLENGSFVIAWQSAGQDGSGLGIYMQRYSAAGARQGAAKRVATTTAGNQASASVSAFTDRGFAVAWTSPDGDGDGIFAQVFDDGGGAVDAEFRLNTMIAGNQNQPALAAMAGGQFAAAWTSAGQDSSSTGIYAQRAKVPIPAN